MKTTKTTTMKTQPRTIKGVIKRLNSRFIMQLAHQLRKNGYTISESLKTAWCNYREYINSCNDNEALIFNTKDYTVCCKTVYLTNKPKVKSDKPKVKSDKPKVKSDKPKVKTKYITKNGVRYKILKNGKLKKAMRQSDIMNLEFDNIKNDVLKNINNGYLRVAIENSDTKEEVIRLARIKPYSLEYIEEFIKDGAFKYARGAYGLCDSYIKDIWQEFLIDLFTEAFDPYLERAKDNVEHFRSYVLYRWREQIKKWTPNKSVEGESDTWYRVSMMGQNVKDKFKGQRVARRNWFGTKMKKRGSVNPEKETSIFFKDNNGHEHNIIDSFDYTINDANDCLMESIENAMYISTVALEYMESKGTKAQVKQAEYMRDYFGPCSIKDTKTKDRHQVLSTKHGINQGSAKSLVYNGLNNLAQYMQEAENKTGIKIDTKVWFHLTHKTMQHGRKRGQSKVSYTNLGNLLELSLTY